MDAQLNWREGLIFDASDGAQEITIDPARKQGHSPMRLILEALAGCAAIDVVEIILKRRKQIESLKINVKGQRREAPHPRIYEAIHLEFVIRSKDVTEREMERALKLSLENYCSIAGMLHGTVEVTSSYVIERSEN